MRINEALSLDADDVDPDTGIVHIRCGKLGKERLLPVHETAVDQLRAYVAQRDRLLGRASVPFFVKCDGSRLGDCGARYNFAHRSEEHTSELQSLMRISYAVFCLKNKTQQAK